MFGFRWAGYIFCLFVALELLVCLTVFGIIGALRLVASLWRKRFRKTDGHWTWGRLGVSNLVEEHENAPEFRLKEPPKKLVEKITDDVRHRRRDRET
jgi:hypothetical protein